MPNLQDRDDVDTSPPLMQRPKSPLQRPEESYSLELPDLYGSSFEMTYKAAYVKISRYLHRGKHRIVLEIRANPLLAPLMAIDVNVVESRQIYRVIKRLSRKRQYRRKDAKKESFKLHD